MEISKKISAATILLMFCSVRPATAAEPPADLCSLLPAAVLSTTLGGNYESPSESVAPRPFRDTNEGTDCTYESGSDSVLFRAYVDPTPPAAQELFARLKSFFGRGSTPVSGVGDEAYSDANGALHVRTGKVRFEIAAQATGEQLKDLADEVVGQL